MFNATAEICYHPQYLLVTDSRSLKAAVEPLLQASILGIDTETTGLDPHKDKLRLVQIAAPNFSVVIVDVAALTIQELNPLKQLLEGNAIKIFHNAKFDWQFLVLNGLRPSGPLFDTQLAFLVLLAGLNKNHSLQALARTLLGVELDKTEQKSNYSSELTPSQLRYAATDAAILLELYPILSRKLKAAKLTDIAEIEFSALPKVAEMELNGMLLDADKMAALLQELVAKKQQYLEELRTTLKPRFSQLSLLPQITDVINPESPAQVLEALQAIGIPINSTEKKVLIPLQSEYPIIKTLLEYRKCSKLISTFVEGLPAHINLSTGRIHPSYRQCSTKSGRFSCRNPNLQNIPRDKSIRSCFIARPGYTIVRADYSQIELRIVAKLSGDRRMRQAYLNGEDLHTLTASLITGKPIEAIASEDRRMAKAINFGLIYGMGPSKLKVYAETEYGVTMTLKQATLFRRRFFTAYSDLKEWHSEIKNTVYATNKREMRTLAGRRRRWSTNPPLSELYNHPVQGSCADFLKVALGKLDAALDGTDAELIGTVHDEIILECPSERVDLVSRILQECMLSPAATALQPIPVEVEIKVGNSWGD